MSKIGKKPIKIPEGVTVDIQGNEIRVKGPKGEMKKKFPEEFSLVLEKNELKVMPPAKIRKGNLALWGTTRAVLWDMIQGANEGFSKVLEFEGIGFRAETNEKELSLFVGFSHPVRLQIPSGLSVTVAKNTITISGADPFLVGEFTAKVRQVKLPEPYKGTGIRYQGEVIKRKAGKKLAGAAGTGGATQ
jgi:large subunit ribosomal protein L6